MFQDLQNLATTYFFSLITPKCFQKCFHSDASIASESRVTSQGSKILNMLLSLKFVHFVLIGKKCSYLSLNQIPVPHMHHLNSVAPLNFWCTEGTAIPV